MSEQKEVPQELIDEWPLDSADLRCECCGCPTDTECGRCFQPQCDDGNCLAKHILDYHDALLGDK